MAQSINLQIIPNGVLPKVYASQFDVGREVQFNLFDGASAYTPPAGTAIRFEGRKSDGTGFSYACTNVGNVVTVELTDQMTVFAEEIPCEIRMALNGDDIGTLNVILCVEKSPIDAGVPISDTEIPAIIDLARQEQYTAEAWAKGTRNGVPVTPGDPTYNNNSEYWAGQSQAATQGALKYKGSCLFANIPTTGLNQGDMWNIEDDFTTDNRFQEGSGIPVKAGSNIAWNSNSKWDVLAMQKIYSLSDLTDTVISSPTDGEVLTYDNVSGKWENKPISVSSIDADDVVYDNTASGLTATDAQAALDEIVGDVNTVQSNIDDVVDMIAPVESGTLASQGYDIGAQFIFGGQLVKATAAITSGQQIVEGSGGNCVASYDLVTQLSGRYTTAEKIVGTWIDGRPLYEKTISTRIPAVQTQGTMTSTYVAMNSDVLYYIDIRGIAQLTSVGVSIVAPYAQAATGFTDFLTLIGYTKSASSNANTIRIGCNETAWNNAPLHITARYIKEV